MQYPWQINWKASNTLRNNAAELLPSLVRQAPSNFGQSLRAGLLRRMMNGLFAEPASTAAAAATHIYGLDYVCARALFDDCVRGVLCAILPGLANVTGSDRKNSRTYFYGHF